MKVLGTCSQCGGPVCMPMYEPKPAACQRCGATPKGAYGPVIETELPPEAKPQLLNE